MDIQQQVQDAVDELVETGAECGLQVAVYERGVQVVDAVAGIAGEIVRRATGRTISQLLRDEIAGPLGVADELYFGVPASEHGRLARIEEAAGFRNALAMFPSPVPPTDDYLNNPDVLAADIPAGGVMTARAVARMYAALLGEGDGVRLVSDERLQQLSAVAFMGTDAIIGFPQVWALGYGIGRPGIEAEPQTAFGMPGIGGSAAYADTATGMAFAITSNRLHFGTAPGLARVGELVSAQ